MAPRRAIEYILSLELPPDEAACIIECDVRRKSCAQVCEALHLSPEAVNRCRRRAYKCLEDDDGRGIDYYNFEIYSPAT